MFHALIVQIVWAFYMRQGYEQRWQKKMSDHIPPLLTLPHTHTNNIYPNDNLMI